MTAAPTQQLPILTYIVTNIGQGKDRIENCLKSIARQDYPTKIAIIVNIKDAGDKNEIKSLLDNLEHDKPAPLPKTNEVYKGKYDSLNIGVISFTDYLSQTEARICGINATYGYSHIFSFIESQDEYVDDELSSLAMSKFILNPNIVGVVYYDLLKSRNGMIEHQLNEMNSSYFISKVCIEQLNKQLPDLSNNYNMVPMLKSHLPIIGIKANEKLRQKCRPSATTAAN